MGGWVIWTQRGTGAVRVRLVVVESVMRLAVGGLVRARDEMGRRWREKGRRMVDGRMVGWMDGLERRKRWRVWETGLLYRCERH